MIENIKNTSNTVFRIDFRHVETAATATAFAYVYVSASLELH